ncbi:MAG: DUF4870 domain-containing protein [Streptosporangiaceae bacterium]
MQPNPDLENAMWAHLGPILMSGAAALLFPLGFCLWIPPLVIRNSEAAVRTPYVRQQATQALNCALTSLLVGIPLLAAAAGLGLFGILGTSGTATVVLVVVAVLLVLLSSGMDFARFVYAVIACSRAREGQPFAYPRLLAFPLIRP